MIDKVKQWFVEYSFDTFLEDKPMSSIKDKKTDKELVAQLVALSCSRAHDGFVYYTCRLLGSKIVEQKYIENISCETIRKVLKKNMGNKRLDNFTTSEQPICAYEGTSP